MDHNKSKSVTTSVPSISIKFHANAEQIEELYASDDETNTNHENVEKASSASNSPANVGQADTSPLMHLSKIGKIPTSIDANVQILDASPPSDPWRFFSDIKGKITRSVEEKITEIKSRNQEEGSSHHKVKGDLKLIKDSKENSSISDSEELSESSISKTCGIVSTTEGAEMSSDEDTPSLEKDCKDVKSSSITSSGGLRQRFRFLRKAHPEEGSVKVNDLSKLYNINAEKIEQVLPEDSEGVESAVDALEEADHKKESSLSRITSEDILKTVIEKFDNIELDSDNMINVKEVTGKDIRDMFYECKEDTVKTIFAPTGFVDLRPKATGNRPFFKYLPMAIFFISVAVYIAIQQHSPYLAGLAAGIIISYVIFQIYLKLYPIRREPIQPMVSSPLAHKILEVHAVKEYQPILKYEGWANEFPDVYDPLTYHISQTQSVFLRLQGNLLRISHSKIKVPKRAMWNEAGIKASFTQHRIYNLLGAKIALLPEGLAKKRYWSKKYPICVTLTTDQMIFDPEVLTKTESEMEKHVENDKPNSSIDKDKGTLSSRDKKGLNRFRRKEYPVLAQRFSKLTEDEEFDLDSDSRASTPSADISDLGDSHALEEDLLNATNEKLGEDINSLPDDWSMCSASPQDNNINGLNLYIFGRTDREKEDWFRRLCIATHKGIGIGSRCSSDPDIKESVSETQIEMEYLKYMSLFKSSKNEVNSTSENKKNESEQLEETENSKDDLLLWLNTLNGRVLFDCMRDPNFTLRVRERIQRKLSTIKLPYFIEEILIPELSLGETPPFVHRISKPVFDDRGLWIDLDLSYEGVIILTLQTKLNLMRLKNPQAFGKPSSEIKSAIYNSDVDDSAESSSDEEGPQEIPNLLQDTSSGSSHSGNKFIKMVDRLAESKFFQAATENRYIKKAMEGVSNTDLRLTVEVKAIIGTLVLNIPPPPSDRVWVGFRPVPEIILSARPIVGERNISYIMVTSWIEKKLLQEFQKVMVIPNMEDFIIPVMNPKLPT